MAALDGLWTTRVVGLSPGQSYTYQVVCDTGAERFEGLLRTAQTTNAPGGPVPAPPGLRIVRTNDGFPQGVFLAPPMVPTACWYEYSFDGKKPWTRVTGERDCTQGAVWPGIGSPLWARFVARTARGTRASDPLRPLP